jgi:hypothetical protein
METLDSRRLSLMVVALAFLAVTLIFVAISLGSGPAAAQQRGATVIKEGTCILNEPGVPVLFTEDLHSVITPSGNTKLTCHFEGPRIPKTVVGRGFLCQTFLGLTRESHFVYTKSGNATLTCRVNPGG